MNWMLDLFRASQLKGGIHRDHILTDDAVMHAVNLGAMVHNMLAAYQAGIEGGDFAPYRRKLYELSAEFHSDEARDARENMRLEWVRRVESREDF
jgi:hypothetical protein